MVLFYVLAFLGVIALSVVVFANSISDADKYQTLTERVQSNRTVLLKWMDKHYHDNHLQDDFKLAQSNHAIMVIWAVISGVAAAGMTMLGFISIVTHSVGMTTDILLIVAVGAMTYRFLQLISNFKQLRIRMMLLDYFMRQAFVDFLDSQSDADYYDNRNKAKHLAKIRELRNEFLTVTNATIEQYAVEHAK